MKEKKTPLSHEVVCVQMVDFETSSSKSEVSKSNSWKITSFSKTMALQRELFLTMFYTINLFPSLLTKKGFMIIIILSNYRQCPLPLNKQPKFLSHLFKSAASVFLRFLSRRRTPQLSMVLYPIRQLFCFVIKELAQHFLLLPTKEMSA